MSTNTFAAHLLANQVFSAEKMREITANAKRENVSLIGYLINHQLLPYKTIAVQISSYFELPLLDFSNLSPNNLPLALVTRELIEKYQVLPTAYDQQCLHLALSDPSQLHIANEIKFHTNLEVKLIVAEFDKLTQLINEILHQQKYEAIDTIDPKIIELVDQVLMDAVTKNASDIHFEPYQESYRIRFRIDGLLYPILTPDWSLANRIAARLKIMANLDIAEHRLPQDGRFSFNQQDCRLSTCPTLHGEKIVLRILNPLGSALSLSDLGLESQQLELMQRAILRPQGMVLVTGPTGSGKTISLYAALQKLNTIHKNISSVEDPVEINLTGINQVPINTKIGLDFAVALRTFLRQDPDIIMLGEIRDTATAEIAIKAAQTGHLVLSTLHTNNTAESVVRLINMGIPPYNLYSTLNLIIAQRLVRKLCPICKYLTPVVPENLLAAGFTPEEIEALPPSNYEASGCDKCFQGYQGRIGIFETLAFTETISRMLIQQASTLDIAKQARAEGNSSLRTAAIHKVSLGLTSIAEITRVV